MQGGWKPESEHQSRRDAYAIGCSEHQSDAECNAYDAGYADAFSEGYDAGYTDGVYDTEREYD